MSLNQHGIDGAPDIIGNQISFDADAAGQRIDLNLREMNAIRIGHVVGAEPALAFQAVGFFKMAGNIAEGYRCSSLPHGNSTVGQAKVVGRGLKKVGGHFQSAVAERLGGDLHGGPRHHRDTRSEGAAAALDPVRLAVNDRDTLNRDIERLRADLCQYRLNALTNGCNSGHDLHCT